jgi:hypothetical protein
MTKLWHTIDLSAKSQELDYRNYIELMHTCRRYLYENIGEENIGWNYTSIPTEQKRRLIFYIQDSEHATAFKLKFA